MPKRRHNSDKMRLGERRRGKDDGSSRDASEEGESGVLFGCGFGAWGFERVRLCLWVMMIGLSRPSLLYWKTTAK